MADGGAAIWPFDGELSSLATPGQVVLAETYPAEAYRHIGVSQGGVIKTQQESRRSKSGAIDAWAAKRGVTFSSECQSQIGDGFGPAKDGEDRFDAFMGLLGMIEVADEHRPEGFPMEPDIRRWEGWIIGQTPPSPY